MKLIWEETRPSKEWIAKTKKTLYVIKNPYDTFDMFFCYESLVGTGQDLFSIYRHGTNTIEESKQRCQKYHDETYEHPVAKIDMKQYLNIVVK